MSRLLAIAAGATAVLVLAASPPPVVRSAADEPTEVVVLLAAPPLARAPGSGSRIAAEQRVFRRELAARVPEAKIRWRYRLVANGFSAVLPSARIARVRALPGVRGVFVSTPYGTQLDNTPQQIGAPALWGLGLETAGQGMKIGIIDTGIDSGHPFFDPTGYSMPPGFPKGQRQYTTAKVIVARGFPAPGVPPRLPFDAGHGTHVAGIAAGNKGTRSAGGTPVSGVAPSAYLGSYKVFDGGLANSPEILAAIEAAVVDGMDVINFSGGQPEIEPGRDIIALGLDAAAAAGVIPVISAGNDFNDLGVGSVSSPGTSRRAITVAAVQATGMPATSVHADFSSVGPTPISVRLKPDVAAPGVGVLSSMPGGWSSISGTSMAAPHVSGAAALLRDRHPQWTVAEIKSALVQTATDASTREGAALAGPTFVGGGVVSLPAADRPLLFAEPSSVSLGLVARRARAEGVIQLRDGGGGVGTWRVTLERGTAPAGAKVILPESVQVPGTLPYVVETTSSAAEGELSGYITLRRDVDVRRVPFWGRVTAPALGRHDAIALRRVGMHKGTTRGRAGLVSRYRYPENPSGVGVSTVLAGPEVVYRVTIGRGVANFGVVVTARGRGSRIEPRVVAGLDENRLTGYAGLPFAANPYLPSFFTRVPAAGALSPAPGEYAVVFDSPARASAGSFAFRYWVHDVTPPKLKLRAATVVRGRPLRVTATDAGSGVFGDTVLATIDGSEATSVFRRGVVSIPTGDLSPGTHRLLLRVSDYQETKNTENVTRILPNTRTLVATVTIRRR